MSSYKKHHFTFRTKQALVSNEITEVTNKMAALDVIREKLQQDLMKLQEDELELDDEPMNFSFIRQPRFRHLFVILTQSKEFKNA